MMLVTKVDTEDETNLYENIKKALKVITPRATDTPNTYFNLPQRKWKSTERRECRFGIDSYSKSKKHLDEVKHRRSKNNWCA